MILSGSSFTLLEPQLPLLCKNFYSTWLGGSVNEDTRHAPVGTQFIQLGYLEIKAKWHMSADQAVTLSEEDNIKVLMVEDLSKKFC